jgi:SAM-dependent methyltransferase
MLSERPWVPATPTILNDPQHAGRCKRGSDVEADRACPVCDVPGMRVFFRREDVPVDDMAFWSTREQAVECEKGSIELAYCLECECIANLGVLQDSVGYDTEYENSLHFSPSFQRYAKSLAADLVERYRLRNKTIVEIGCGKGEFLAMLCELGENRGIGFDPSYASGRGDCAAGRGIKYIQEFYSDSAASHPGDFICCRQVLEHISDAREFLAMVRRNSGQTHAPVFFEVPNARYMLEQVGVWDIIYPHAFYFLARTLDRLFTSCGFNVLALREGFEGQYLLIEASPCSPSTRPSIAFDECPSRASLVHRFEEAYRERVDELSRIFARLRGARQQAVVWGAGAKAVAFLNKFKLDAPVDYVIDVNPYKQGKFLPGTGQQVMAPEFLKELRPDCIVIMNPNYRDEIARQVAELGLSPDFLLA